MLGCTWCMRAVLVELGVSSLCSAHLTCVNCLRPQILYNRALAQLGMCAFRHGMIKDAHDALLDIQSSGRSKELLAQGLMASKDRSQEQEKIERRRLVRSGWGGGMGLVGKELLGWGGVGRGGSVQENCM